MKTIKTTLESFLEAKNNNYYQLNESGYARIVNIMRGLVPTVKTFAFISAENPNGEKQSNEENNKATKELKTYLKSKKIGFVKVDGNYGYDEHSFFLTNITKSEALKIGKKFSQDSLILVIKRKMILFLK